ncbi:MAG: hypothetical protein Q8S16_12265, partial [Polaromonas sp.]|nr:hypothetical protein [Polaromonas sp.]
MRDYSQSFGWPTSRGLPGGNYLDTRRAKKKVSKEKGDPMVRVPPLRCGQPPVLAESGIELDSLRSESLALIRFRLRSSAQPDGWGKSKVGDKNPEQKKRAALLLRESPQTG